MCIKTYTPVNSLEYPGSVKFFVAEKIVMSSPRPITPKDRAREFYSRVRFTFKTIRDGIRFIFEQILYPIDVLINAFLNLSTLIQLLLIAFSLAVVSLFATQLQQSFMRIFDAAYQCVFYQIFDFLGRWFFIPIRFLYESIVVRWNDFWLYIVGCISSLIQDLLDLSNVPAGYQRFNVGWNAVFDFLTD